MKEQELVIVSRTMWLTLAVGFLAVACTGVVQAQVNIPLEGLKLVPLPGLSASSSTATQADVVAAVRFTKTSDERRLLALETKPASDATGAKALVLRYRLQLLSGEAPRLAVVAFDAAGGSWYKVNAHPAVVDEMTEGRLSVSSLRPTAFSATQDTIAWWDVEKLWIGLVIDGPANGILEVSQARLTDEPYKPTKPLNVTGDGPGTWSASQNPAVKGTITTPNEGPDGQACLKYEFTAPGGQHRWMIPSTPVPNADLEGYTALRFMYKATLPKGINSLLVMVGERGGAQYCADPAPLPVGDWMEVTIPFEDFTLGSWTKDANGRLDLQDVSSVMIGAHGVPSEAQGKGLIMATNIQFVP